MEGRDNDGKNITRLQEMVFSPYKNNQNTVPWKHKHFYTTAF